MDILEFKNSGINEATAYILGLIYPLYKEKTVNSKNCILGCVNHNPKKVTQDEINQHYKDVFNLMETCLGEKAPDLKTNKTQTYTISPKQGFTVLIEKTNISKEECLEILKEIIKQINSSSVEIKQKFVRGCFDGRSSWDKSSRYLSIDVDRDYEKQDLIAEIIETLGVDININRRDKAHAKNDQIRIKPSSINKYMDDIGMYSVCRRNIVQKAYGLY